MITYVRQHLILSLLLFSVGAAGAVAYAIASNSGRGAAPAAGGEQSGTGTVVGGTGPQSPGPDPGGNGNAQGPSGVFYISGTVDGLVPGQPGTLPLTVTNPNPWPIQVLTLDTGVDAPAGSPCPASTLTVGDYTYTDGAKFSAPAKGTVRVSVPIELTDSATQDQSGCLGSSFPLTFTGTAVKTAR